MKNSSLCYRRAAGPILLFACAIVVGVQVSTPSKDFRRPSSQVADQNLDCRPTAIADLKSVYDGFGRMPRFLLASFIASIKECLGPGEYLNQVHELAGRVPAAANQVYPNREFNPRPQEMADAETYMDQFNLYTESSKWIDRVTTGAAALTLTGKTGAVLKSNPEFMAPALTFTAISVGALALAKEGIEAWTEYQTKDLFESVISKDRFDNDALLATLGNSDPRIRDEAFWNELQYQALAGLDLNKLLPRDLVPALKKTVETIGKGLAEVNFRADRNEQDILVVAHKVADVEKRMEQYHDEAIANVQIIEGQVQYLNQKVSSLGKDVKFMRQLWMDRMTTREKISAIKDYNWGDPDPVKKKKQLESLEKLAEFQQNMRKVTNFGTGVISIASALKAMGVDDERLDKAIDLASKGQAVAEGFAQMAMGGMDAFKGIMTISSAFGKKTDVGGARHAQIMAALRTIIQMQIEIINNQKQMMVQLGDISLQIDAGNRAILAELDHLGEEAAASSIEDANRAFQHFDLCLSARKTMSQYLLEREMKLRVGNEAFEEHEKGKDAAIPVNSFPIDGMVDLFADRGENFTASFAHCTEVFNAFHSVNVDSGYYALDAPLKFSSSARKVDERKLAGTVVSWNKALAELYLNNYKDSDDKADPALIFSATLPVTNLRELIRKTKFVESTDGKAAIKKMASHPHWNLLREALSTKPGDAQINAGVLLQMANILTAAYPAEYVRLYGSDRAGLAGSVNSKNHTLLLEQVLAMLDVAIAQQTLYYGDYILEKADRDMNLAPKLDTPKEAVEFLVEEQTINPARDIHYAMQANPVFRQNVISYRIMKKLMGPDAQKFMPAAAYDLAYNFKDSQGKPSAEYMNEFLRGTGLTAEWQTESATWVAKFKMFGKAQLDQLKNLDEEKYKAAVAEQNATVTLLPTPAEFMMGDFAASPMISDLIAARQEILQELLYLGFPKFLSAESLRNKAYNSLLEVAF